MAFRDGAHAAMMAVLTSIADEQKPMLYVGSGLTEDGKKAWTSWASRQHPIAVALE
jgi:hypothetical protein